MGQKIFNTLTKKKEDFKPLEENKVKIYLCGPTVYDILHIGNFRGAITFNLIRNWLEYTGYDVTFVYNFTDVDDKIIKRANEEGVSSLDISEKYIDEFKKDFNRLGLRPHDHNPKVTEFMPEIIQFVEKLIENKKAYVIDGEVFYALNEFEDYGKLSGKCLDDLVAGQRVEVDSRKKNPHDFVLWKPSKEGEPSWDSPWGKGRPGWHIECSAMIQSILGETIDIHGGGIDLIFPHHENEIAQGEGATGKKYCSYWVHNQFLNLKDQKMSKSLGNVVTARSFMDEYDAEVLKYMMLSVHYRSQINLGEDKIKDCLCCLHRIYEAKDQALSYLENNEGNFDPEKADSNFSRVLKTSSEKINKALLDDFNMGEVFAAIFEGVRAYNSLKTLKKKNNEVGGSSSKAFLEWLDNYGKMMALFQEKPETVLNRLDEIVMDKKGISKDEVNQLVAKRSQARADKNWELSDQLRDQLLEMGIALQDGNEKRPWTTLKN